MMEGQQGYEKYCGRPQQKRKKNKQSEQSKFGKKCAASEFIPLTKEATVSSVTICGGSLFQTSITQIGKNCARIFTHESGQYNLYPLVHVRNLLRVILVIPFRTLKQVTRSFVIKRFQTSNQGSTCEHEQIGIERIVNHVSHAAKRQ